MVKLDKRLRAVLDQINCHTLLDIGCDHGKISVAAVLENRAKRVLAADISRKSLEKTKQLAKLHNVENYVHTIVSDGFKNVNEPFDQAVIAGIGGHEIVSILTASCFSDKLVLLPHQDADVLRSFISGRFGIIKDTTIECNNKYYPLIVLTKGNDYYTQEQLSYGRFEPNNADFIHMMAHEKIRQRKIALSSNDFKKYNEVLNICLKLGI